MMHRQGHVRVSPREGGGGGRAPRHGVQQELKVWVQWLGLAAAVAQAEGNNHQQQVEGREGHLTLRHLSKVKQSEIGSNNNNK